MEARNPSHTRETQKLIGDLNRLGWYHSIELPDGGLIQGLQTVEQLRLRMKQFPIPEDLRGKRVLDIGAWDGWFSFEMEKRGAEVMAIDAASNTRFLKARELLGSRVEYRIADICRITPREIGYFDIVLFFGVLYHLKHPMLALERVCELSTDMAFVESFVTDDGPMPGQPPLLDFYETTELGGQFDNWVGPNCNCLLAMCRTAGFARVQFESTLDRRAHVSCFRRWSAPVGQSRGPEILCIENSVSRDHRFSSALDDYAAFWFEDSRGNLAVDEIFPEIGPYGTRPVEVHRTSETGWHVNCKIPPGLAPGWYDARLRVRDTGFGNRVRIAIDVPEGERERPGRVSETLEIRGVTDGRTWEPNRVQAGSDACVSVWAAGLPLDCERSGVSIRWNGTDLPATWVSEPDGQGIRQVNALLPSGIGPGAAWVWVAAGAEESAAVQIELI